MGANQNAQKLLSTDLVNTNMNYVKFRINKSEEFPRFVGYVAKRVKQ